MSKSKKLAIGFGAAIAIVAIVVCVIPLEPVSYTVSVPYQDVETYYVSEPYEVQEPYETNEAYEVEEPYTYTDTGTATLFDDKYSVKAGYYLALPTYIRLHDSDFVSGTVEETTDHDITLYVFDQKNYNAYKAGQSYTP